MKTTMDMSSYEVEQDVLGDEYGDEILTTGWNPAVDQVCEQLLQVPSDEHNDMLSDIAALNSVDEFSSAVSEIFLRKMYSYQS